jgi:hypothetical protein
MKLPKISKYNIAISDTELKTIDINKINFYKSKEENRRISSEEFSGRAFGRTKIINLWEMLKRWDCDKM